MDLKYIGNYCREYRHKIGKYQSVVARDTNYSIENVSSFENGRNDNLRIFLWYIENGMDIANMVEHIKNEKI